MHSHLQKFSIKQIHDLQNLITGVDNLAELKVSLATALGNHWPEKDDLAVICGLQPDGAAGACDLARERGLLDSLVPPQDPPETTLTIPQIFALEETIPLMDTHAEIKVSLAIALSRTWPDPEELGKVTGLSRKSVLTGCSRVRERGLLTRFLPEPPEGWGLNQVPLCPLLREITEAAGRLDRSVPVDMPDYLQGQPQPAAPDEWRRQAALARQTKLLVELDVAGGVEQALMVRGRVDPGRFRMSFGYVTGYVHRHVYQTRHATEQGAVKHDLAGFLVRSLAFDWPPLPGFDHLAMLELDGWNIYQVFNAVHDTTIDLPALWESADYLDWRAKEVYPHSPVKD